jgi:hypothetical protein
MHCITGDIRSSNCKSVRWGESVVVKKDKVNIEVVAGDDMTGGYFFFLWVSANSDRLLSAHNIKP